MAKIIKKAKRNTSKIKVQNGFFNRIKITESYTSLLLGAIVVLIVGIVLILFAKGNRNMQTSSISEDSQNSSTSSTYTIKPGDDLWTISENIYNDGYKWVEIAKINNLNNPGLIYVGDKLVLPTKTQEKNIVANTQVPSVTSDKIIQNNSITSNSYTVVIGDNLWDIAVRAYGDGFKWPEIVKANSLQNPSLIHPGNVFKIPR